MTAWYTSITHLSWPQCDCLRLLASLIQIVLWPLFSPLLTISWMPYILWIWAACLTGTLSASSGLISHANRPIALKPLILQLVLIALHLKQLVNALTATCLKIYIDQLTTTYHHWPYNSHPLLYNLCRWPYSCSPYNHPPYVNPSSLITTFWLMTAGLMSITEQLMPITWSLFGSLPYNHLPYINHLLKLITLWQLTAAILITAQLTTT